MQKAVRKLKTDIYIYKNSEIFFYDNFVIKMIILKKFFKYYIVFLVFFF